MTGLSLLPLASSSIDCGTTFAGTIDLVIGLAIGVGLLLSIINPLIYKTVIQPSLAPEGGVIPARFTAPLYPAERWVQFARVRSVLLKVGLIPIAIGLLIILVATFLLGPEAKACAIFF